MDVLFDLLVKHDDAIPLDQAALAIAAIERPALIPSESLARLDGWAEEFRQHASDDLSGDDFLSAFHSFFFRELGFDGDRQDYYDPRNSCLDQVLERKTGIPITLSVVYMELARRLGKTVFGIGLPGHFVVEYVEGGYQAYVDVFHSRIRTAEECLATSAMVTGQTASPESLARVDRRAIVLRMLRNLQGIYMNQSNWVKAVQVIDWLVLAEPGNAAAYATRADALYQLGRVGPASHDLEKLIELAPSHPDVSQWKERLGQWKRLLAGYN